MRKLIVVASALLLGMMAATANAQTQASGAAHIQAQARNATPIVTQAACRGWGSQCPPGYIWTCYRYRCWCRPCY